MKEQLLHPKRKKELFAPKGGVSVFGGGGARQVLGLQLNKGGGGSVEFLEGQLALLVLRLGANKRKADFLRGWQEGE